MKLVEVLVVVQTTLLLVSKVDTELIAKRKGGYVQYIEQWRLALPACVRAKGQHFEQLLI